MRKLATHAAATKDDLKRAFLHMEKRLDKKFSAIDERFTAIDGKFTAIDGKFTMLEQSLDKKLARQKGDILTVLDLRLAQQKDDILRRMDEKLAVQTEAVIKGVATDVHDMFMPTIEEHDNRLDVLDHHTTHPPVSSAL